MNLNQLAKEISALEGKKVQVNIAQIKEVLGCLGRIFRRLEIMDRVKIIRSITEKAGLRKK